MRALRATVRGFVQFAVLLVLTLAVRLASADDLVNEARAKMELGQKYFSEGKFAEALAEFEGAYAKQPFKSFLYNAAVAAERAGDRDRAISRYKEFLNAEPNAPDANQIRATIERLQKEDRTAAPSTATATAEIRSALIVLTEPAGAPVSIYERFIVTAPLFDPAKAENPGWKKIATGLVAPVDLPLQPGFYHVEVEAFRDYRRMGTDQKLDPGTLVVYKAGLSQGDFVGKVQIKTPVDGAKIYVDDPAPHKNAPIGSAPSIIELAPGKHTLQVEAPGYERFETTVQVEQGKLIDVQAFLERLPFGYLSLKTKSADGYAIEEMEVSIDGADPVVYPATKPVRLKLPAGTHTIEVDAPGMKAVETSIEIPRGQELPVAASLYETKSLGPAIGTLLFSGFMAGTGGVLFGLRDQDIFEGDGKDVATYVGTGCFIGAGAVLGLSVFFFIYDPQPASTSEASAATEFTATDEKPEPAKDAKKTSLRTNPARSENDSMLRASVGIAPMAQPGAFGLTVLGQF
jgi:Tfp pilus assembly protein PilF